MKAIGSLLSRAAYVMHLVAGVLLVLMVATTLVDVLSRFLFGITDGALDVTFRGGVEIVSYGLLFMVLFALPHSVSRGQVVVDLFTDRLRRRSKRLISGLYMLGFALLGGGMAVRFYEAIGNTLESGETTQDLLIPLYYIYAVAAVATAVLGLRSLVLAADRVFGAGEAA